MRKLILIVLYIAVIACTKIHAKGEFYYDRSQLDSEFTNLENNCNPLLVKPNPFLLQTDSTDTTEFTLYDLDLEPFCTGLCCGPVGLVNFTKKDKTSVEKKSFWVGCSTFGAGVLLTLAAIIFIEGGPFFF